MLKYSMAVKSWQKSDSVVTSMCAPLWHTVMQEAIPLAEGVIHVSFSAIFILRAAAVSQPVGHAHAHKPGIKDTHGNPYM